jgi:hypothetical protein
MRRLRDSIDRPADVAMKVSEANRRLAEAMSGDGGSTIEWMELSAM